MSASQAGYLASNIFHSYATRIHIPIRIRIGTTSSVTVTYYLYDKIYKRDLVRVLQHDINNHNIVAFNFHFHFWFSFFFLCRVLGDGWCIRYNDNHCINRLEKCFEVEKKNGS